MRRIGDRVVSHRGWIAALLATASILVLLLPWIRDAVDLPEWTESIGGYLLPLTAGLWLLAVLSIGLRRALQVEVSIVAYGLAFALPAADLSATRSAEETVAGYEAFGFGYVVEPLAWLANPGFLLALELHRSRWFGWSAVIALIAALLALSVVGPIMLPYEAPCGVAAICHVGLQLSGSLANEVMIGYWLWAAAPVILLAAALASWARGPWCRHGAG